MDDFILFISTCDFPPDTKSSLGGKRHTARIQIVQDEPTEELRQVSWSVRANPTIHALPHAFVPEAVEKLIDYAKDKCPVMIFFILDDVPNEPWMVELIKLFIDRTAPNYRRQVFVRIASSKPQEVDESVQEVFDSLGSLGKQILSINDANPPQWCCYLDFCLPFESTTFSMIAHHNEPVTVDMFLPNDKRNQATFIDILWPSAPSDLTMNNLNGVELEIILPGRVERALKSMMDGGLMILSTAGYIRTCYWALMPTTDGFVLLGLQQSPTPPSKDPIEGIKQITTAVIHEEMFTDPNFNFDSVTEMTDCSETVTYHQVSLRDALKAEMEHLRKEETPAVATDAVFFPPDKMVGKSKLIQDSVKKFGKLNGKTTSIPSPIKRIMNKYGQPTIVSKVRPFETVSGSSKKNTDLENIKRLNSLTVNSRKRFPTSRAQAKPLKKDNKKQTPPKQKLLPTVFKRSSSCSTTAISRSYTDSELSKRPHTKLAPPTLLPATVSCALSGSEKKKKLLEIIQIEVRKHNLNKNDPVYKTVVKKLHEMSRSLLKGLGTDRQTLIPIMEQTVRNNAPIIIQAQRLAKLS